MTSATRWVNSGHGFSWRIDHQVPGLEVMGRDAGFAVRDGAAWAEVRSTLVFLAGVVEGAGRGAGFASGSGGDPRSTTLRAGYSTPLRCAQGYTGEACAGLRVTRGRAVLRGCLGDERWGC